MNNNDFSKKKYLKYKKKYLNLKNINILKGGMGYNKQYWNENINFSERNKQNELQLLLSLNYNQTHQFTSYGENLDKLLKIDQETGLINLDFITNFFRNIYYDTHIPNKYAITKWVTSDKSEYIYSNYAIKISIDPEDPTKTKKKATWIYPEKNNYIIDRMIEQPHGNTTIIFLKNKNKELPDKVLKIFNNIYCSFDTIKDYLSLEIIHITKTSINPSLKEQLLSQLNYFPITPEEFDTINFNMQTEFILTQNNERILLGSPNNDAINDYIINLILQNINNKATEKINFVKYDNLFVTEIVSPGTLGNIIKTCYCILMEKIDNSIPAYFDEIKNKPLIERQDKIASILTESDHMLNILKTPEYLFTHTDMKCENLFYKKEGERPIIYLADFDKASISYHNVRFYNNIMTSPTLSLLTKQFTNKYSLLNSFVKTDEYTKKDLLERQSSFANNTLYKYRISRIGKNVGNIAGVSAEFEQLYMRYNFTPFYTNFDIITLILSIINKKIIGNLKPEKNSALYNIICSYIIDDDNSTGTNYNILTELFNSFHTLAPINDGNFGELINLLIRTRENMQNVMFIQRPQVNNYLYINKLFLSERNKIALSIPFAPNINISERFAGVFYGVSETSVIKLDSQQPLYSSDNSDDKLLITKLKTFVEKNPDNFVLEFSADYHGGAGAILKPTNYIIKTNRYSYTKPESMILRPVYNAPIYDWDNFNEGQKNIIIELFKQILDYQKKLI